MRAIVLVLTLVAVPVSVVATAGGASQLSTVALSRVTTENTCELRFTKALRYCAHYTDVGRDRCDAKAEKSRERCRKLSGLRKHPSANTSH